MGSLCSKRKYSTNTVEVLENVVQTKQNTGEEQKQEIKVPEDQTLFLVGEAANIKPDQFTEVKITDDKSVLVARHGSNFYAIGSKCPHAGAPLIKGVLIDGKVRCPWHAACFDLKTGDLEDFPGFDCIPSYPVKQDGSTLYVQVNPKTMVETRQKSMKKLTEKNKSVVIVGSGPSGYSCAQTLREEGYDGRIVMITSDAYLPYDRTKLTKKFGCQFDDIKIRSETFYDDNGIEVLLEAPVQSIDVQKRTVTVDHSVQTELTFDFLYIAVGMRPRRYTPGVSGDYLENIFTLHSLHQCIEISEKAAGKDVVLVGSSFIAMELAELLSPVAKQIHILSRGKVPYGAAFGEPTGEALLKHFLGKLPNVKFHAQTEVLEFLEHIGEVSGVVTTTNETIECQLVVLAMGGVPNTEFLVNSEIQLHPKTKTILLNEYLETNCTGIFAGGDAVTYPIDLAPEKLGNVAHWQLASKHGKIAALNILGRQENVSKIVPFFWTNICGLQVRFTGYAEGHDETLVFGDTEALYFCVVYRRNLRLIAVCCVGCDNLASELALIFQNNNEWISRIPEPITQRFKNKKF